MSEGVVMLWGYGGNGAYFIVVRKDQRESCEKERVTGKEMEEMDIFKYLSGWQYGRRSGP